MALNLLYAFLLSILGFPSGIMIAIIAKEELKQGRKYFKILSLVLLVGILGSLIYSLMYNDFIMLFSFIFLFGIPTGSLIAIKYPRILSLKAR